MRWLAFIAAMVTVALVLGCEKKDQTKNPTGVMPSGATTRPGAGATDTGKPEPVPAEATTSPASTTPLPAPSQMQAPATRPAAAPAPAVDPAKAAADAKAKATAEAQSKLDQVMGYIKSNKLDMADTTLKQLEATKDSLPAELQSKITTARQTLDAARKSPVKMPGGLGI